MGNGYSFVNYKSNFITTLDKEFSLKADRFNGCKTEENVHEMMNQLMELKYPIHLRRIDALNPTINSNEEASSMLKRMVVTFNEAKMVQSHWENNLLHFFLKHLPESEVFRKQKEWVSNYLSELSNKGANTRADLAKSERQIQRIEAELRQNIKPTYQSANNRNRRAKQDEKQEARRGICNKYGHTKENCKSPCYHCQQPGHRNRECPKRSDRGRSKSRGREKGRINSSSRQRGQSSKRRNHSPYPKRKGKKKGSKNNRSRNYSPNKSESDTDRSSRSQSGSESETEQDTPPRGEKSKKHGRSNRDRGRYNKDDYHNNNRIVADHKNRRIGGKANPTPHVNVRLFRKASDLKPQNEKLETAVGDTGCTTSCIPWKMAKEHSLKIEKVDSDEPLMKSYHGANMKIKGQTKCYIQIQHRKGFTSKKLLHALVIEDAYDQEILISWDNCIL